MVPLKQEFYDEHIFLTNLKGLLKQKQILINSVHIRWINKTYKSIILSVFYKHDFLKKIKKRNRNIIENEFNNKLKVLQTNQFFIKLNTLNQKLNYKIIKSLIKPLAKYKNNLFMRRVDLFSDIIKLSSLLIEKKLKCDMYLLLLAQIFSVILKKKHTQFMAFIKFLLKKMISKYYCQIKGIYFMIKGKLKGKPRASVYKVAVGIISRQTIKTKIEYSKIHTYNRFGAFGLKL